MGKSTILQELKEALLMDALEIDYKETLDKLIKFIQTTLEVTGCSLGYIEDKVFDKGYTKLDIFSLTTVANDLFFEELSEILLEKYNYKCELACIFTPFVKNELLVFQPDVLDEMLEGPEKVNAEELVEILYKEIKEYRLCSNICKKVSE